MNQYEMLNNTKKIIVGFSGGADSSALLHFLFVHASNFGKNFIVEAVHINHNLRGEESLRDELSSKEFCKKLNIKLHIKKIDVRKISETKKIGTEEAGRIARYEIFKRLSCENGCKIATAHTLSDNCETFILNLLRGTSVKGLCGIPPVRDNIIRPLISVSRQEIEDYCKINNIKYIDDSSNFTRNYTRNKVRLDIIPLLKNINPNFESSLNRTINTLKKDSEYLEKISNKSFYSIKNFGNYNINNLKALPECIQNRVIGKIIKENIKDKPLEQKHIDLVKNFLDNKKNIILPNNSQIYFENGFLKISKVINNQKEPFNPWSFNLKAENNLTQIGLNIIIKIMPISEYRVLHKKLNSKNVFDFDKISSSSIIRNRRQGDKFQLPFRNITKSLKKLLNELKIPVNLRNNLPIIEDKGEIVWIDKIGTSNKYILSSSTKNVAVIEEINLI